VLGQVELVRGGEVVVDDDWQRRQMVRSLLALVLERRRVHRLDVIELLWPGHADEAKAVGNLRTTLSMLQRILEPDRERDDPPFFLRSDQDHLTVHPSVTSDAAEFDALVAAAQADDQAGLPARALHGYQRALEVYRGDYLADVDAAWAVFTRLRLRSLALNAACRVAELLAARGEPEESARLAQRALLIDPNSERAGRLLVAAIDATGDRSAAREAGRALLAMLDRIDAPPAPETVRVLVRIGVPVPS
jgi:LuxR family transcriptional regulator, maltose regulon positive regulatory protein